MFIAVDLKVIEGLSDATARAAGVGADRILAGLVRLWHRCWSDEIDHLGRSELSGIFGGRDLDTIIEALCAFGFLQPTEAIIGPVWRIRGADRYLRLRESRRRGGLASIGNLKRGTQPGSRAGEQPGSSRGAAGTQPQLLHRAPSTEHRAPSTKEEAAAVVPLPVSLKPDDPFDSPEGFWTEVQVERREQGLPPEKPPHPQKLASWWSVALMELNGEPKALGLAYVKFTRDKYWRAQAPPAPFAGFISQWRNYVPARRQA